MPITKKLKRRYARIVNDGLGMKLSPSILDKIADSITVEEIKNWKDKNKYQEIFF